MKQRRSPATAVPCVPSTCMVSRSSRRTRTHQDVEVRDRATLEFERRVRRVVRRARIGFPFSSQRAERASRRDTSRPSPRRTVVEHVAPVAEHVEDDAAAILLSVVPRRPLAGLTRIPFEHPIAELAAHRQDVSEEARIAQRLRASAAREPKLVLHDAVLDTRLPGCAIDVERGRERGCHRLLAVDVLAGRDSLLDEPGPKLRRSGIEKHGVPTGPQAHPRGRSSSARCRGSWRAPAACPCSGPASIGSGMTRVPSARRTPPSLADFEDGAHEVLVGTHPAGHAVHDDSYPSLAQKISIGAIPDVGVTGRGVERRGPRRFIPPLPCMMIPTRRSLTIDAPNRQG